MARNRRSFLQQNPYGIRQPFHTRIHTDPEQLENYEPVSDEDGKKYYLRGQNFKFTSPETFVFIDTPVEFLAMEVDDDSNVKSILLYLDNKETMLENLRARVRTFSLSQTPLRKNDRHFIYLFHVQSPAT